VSSQPPGVVLIFDGTCGFCLRFIGWLQRLDRRSRIVAIANRTPGIVESNDLTREEVDRAAWTVDPEGRRLEGAAAINRVLAELSLPLRLAAMLYQCRPIRWLEDRIYIWISGHRQMLSRMLGETACPVATSQPGTGTD
jgi:acetyl esterase